MILVGLAALVATVPIAIVASRSAITSSGREIDRDSPTAPPQADSTSPSGEFAHFRDEEGMFAISYPTAWRKLPAPDPQVRLLVARNDRDSLLVRVARLAEAVTADQLPAMQEMTSRVIASGEQVQLLAGPERVEAGGVPGYFYFYTFKDQVSGERGAHSHYFLFNGGTMVTVVFQTVPETAFEELAPTFDKIISTLRLL
jgi:hypothetical protein